MKRRWLWALIPALIGLLLATVLQQSETANPMVRVAFPLSAAIFIVGIAATALWAGGVGLSVWYGRRQQTILEQQQQQAGEDRRRFMQRLDHELKNPLTAIRASIANLVSANDDAAYQVALSTLSGQTARLSRLTADLRKIADLEVRALERTSVNMRQLLTEVVELVQENPETERRQLTLILPQAPWPLPDVSGDWDLIFLALYNLVDNALKYTRPGDTIEIRARQDDGYVAVEVADTGIGIPVEALPHVWEELYRGENGRSVPGSGLGLALVKAVVERHGGRVALESRIEQGSNVTIRLPIKDVTNL